MRSDPATNSTWHAGSTSITRRAVNGRLPIERFCSASSSAEPNGSVPSTQTTSGDAAFVKALSEYHHVNRNEGGAKFAAEQARCAVEAMRFGVSFAEGTVDHEMWREMVGQ